MEQKQDLGDGRAVAATPSSQQDAVSPVPASIPIAQPFERHSDLALWIGRLAHSPIEGMTLQGWGNFLGALNSALSRERNEAYVRGQIDQHDDPLPRLVIESFRHAAQAIEARRAETGTGSACESAVAESDAPKENDHG